MSKISKLSVFEISQNFQFFYEKKSHIPPTLTQKIEFFVKKKNYCFKKMRINYFFLPIQLYTISRFSWKIPKSEFLGLTTKENDVWSEFVFDVLIRFFAYTNTFFMIKIDQGRVEIVCSCERRRHFGPVLSERIRTFWN